MGAVYRATDTFLDRTVALKFLAAHLVEHQEGRERPRRTADPAAMAKQQQIACIGLGLLGSALALRLAEAGFAVTAFDPEPVSADLAQHPHFQRAASAARAASGKSAVVLCLPNSDVSATVLDEIQGSLAPGTLVVDTTTGDPEQVA